MSEVLTHNEILGSTRSVVAQSTIDPLASYRTKNSWRSLSNAISLLRAILALPAVYCIAHGYFYFAASIFFVAFLSDLADGYIARRSNEVTEWGKIIDPLADKIFVISVVVSMLYFSMLPVWFVLTVVTRDLIILCAGIWASKKIKVVLPSNYPGKGAVLSISLTLFFIVLGLSHSLIVFMEFLSVGLMVLSLIVYAGRLVRVLKAIKT